MTSGTLRIHGTEQLMSSSLTVSTFIHFTFENVKVKAETDNTSPIIILFWVFFFTAIAEKSCFFF